MAEDAYNKKISDLQKHIPFLENMIAQLKDPKGKPREAQLTKLEAVHNMITDRNKKWKFETLLKCEEVITKLQTKVMANRLSALPESTKDTLKSDRTKSVSQTVSEIMNALKFNNARAKLNCEITTPKSPSPVRDPPVKLPPKIIPTENTKATFKIDPNEFNIGTWKTESAVTEERYDNEKPDIYSSAAKSLISPPTKPPASIFDRLGPVVVPDTTKPLLSDADLESLRTGEDFDVTGSGTEQTKLKEKDKPPSDLNLSKSTPRIVPVPSSKPKSAKLECPKHDASKAKAPPPKVEKLKDSDMFGNLLTSIDSKILEDSKKKEGKKKEHEKKGSKRHERKEKSKADKTDPVVNIKEEKIEVKVEVPSDKPVRLADKYNPKPKKHVETDIEKAVDDSIQKRMENDPRISLKIDIFTNSKDRNFENRDPRRRLSILQESPPPQQQQQQHQQQPPGAHYIPPQPQRSVIELPLIRDPRRSQSRFSPPPPLVSPYSQTQNFHQSFIPPAQNRNVFNNHQSRLDNYHNVNTFQQQQQQQNFFNHPNYQAPTLRYEQNPPSVRFEPPPTQPGVFGNVPKKSFNPFEPLDSGRDEKDSPDYYNFNNQVHQPLQSPPPELQSGTFQRGNYVPPSRGGAKFRGGANYNQYAAGNRQDRNKFDRNNEYRRPPFAQSKTTTPEISRERTKKDEGYKYCGKDVSRTKYDEMYSKLEKDKETFVSPLESLYSDPKTSIKTTIQSFKIPKKHKVEEVEPPPHVEKQKDKSSLKAEHKNEKSAAAKAKPVEVKAESKVKKKLETSDESNSDSIETFEEKKRTNKKVRAKKDPSPPPPPLAEIGSSDSDVPLKIVLKKRSARVTAKKKPPKYSDDDSDDDFCRKSRRAKTAAKKRLIEDSDETDSDEKTPTKKITDKEKKDEARTSRHIPIKKEENDVKTLEDIEVKDVKVIVEKNINVNKKIVKAEKKVNEAEFEDVTKEHVQHHDVIKSEEEKEVQKKCEKEKEVKKKFEEEKLAKKGEEEKLPKKTEEEMLPKKGEEEKVPKKEEEEKVPKKEEEEKPPKKTKEPKSDVDKAKELLTETKAGSLDIDDKELIEFVLQNFKKIRQLFKKDSSSDEEDEAESKKKKKKEPEKDVASAATVTEEEQPPLPPPPQPPPPPPEESPKEEKPKIKPVVVIKKKPGPKPKGRFRKGAVAKKVVKSVGRMTRTRTATLLAAPKRPRRSELDKLHEDIKEMLMGGEVLTASAKRACTIQKDEQDDASEKSAADDENIILSKLMDSSKVDPSKLKAKGANLRVLIEKTDLAKLLINDELKKKEKGKVAGDEVVNKGEEEVVGNGSGNLEPQMAFDKNSPKQQKFLKKKRRRFNWASGVIKKKKKGGLLQKAPPSESKAVDENPSYPSDDESLAESFGSCPEMGELLYVEPSKEYYPKDGKHECKLCPFKGKFIVQHYKGIHPEHEVLISRMNPSFSQKVILESYENKYESLEAFEMLNAQSTRKKRFSYQCPFCLLKFLNENSEIFYDHLSSHTGEYRFSCPYCSFKTSTGKNLRPHIMSSHNRSSENVVKPSWPAPPNFKYVFGYLCAECHYVQLNRSAVEDHVKIYHLDSQKIHKINMSAMPCEEVDDVEGEIPEIPEPPPSESGTNEVGRHIDEAIDRVARAHEEPVKPPVSPPKKKKKKGAVVPQVKQLKVFDLISKISTDEPIIKVEPPDEFPETEATLPEVQVQAETTPPVEQPQADTTPPEVQAQAETTPPVLPIETKVTPPVLQVQTETTLPKRKSPDLNAFMCNPDLTVEEHFVEENRLKKMKEIHEIVKPSRTSIVDKLQSRLDTTASPPVELQSNPPVESEMPTNSASVEKPPPLVFMDRSNQKKPIESVLPKHPVTTTEALPQKKVAPISNIINRLQDKLVSEVNKLPPLTHYRNLQTEGTPDLFLRIGPVQVMLNKNFILYACFVPTCVFCTDKQNIFETHCKVTHKDFICTFKEQNKCDVCHVKIDHDGDYITMHDAYEHLVTSHDDFLKKLASKKEDSVQAEEEVGDDQKPSTSACIVSEFKLPHEVPNLISQGDEENTGAKYPFVITSVTSLAPPKKNKYEEAVTNALLEKAVASSSSAAVKCDRAKPKQDLIRPVSLSKLCAPAEPAVSPSTLSLSPLNKSKPIILNAGNVNNAAVPATPAKKSPVVFNKIVISSSPSTTPPQQPPVLLNHFIGNHQSNSGNVLPRIPSLTLGANAAAQGSPTKTTPTSTSPKRQIVLRDIPLKLVEKTQLRKSPNALSALLSLKKNRQLFKCPEFYCNFSTDLSIKLTKHMSAVHNFTDQALLFCLYCDYKVSCETYAIHVEVKHGHCAYGCEYCLHRTTSVYFVNFHQELQHPQLPSKVLSIPLFPTSVKAISSDATLSLRKVALPYVCGNWGCKFKTLFTCDFVNHLSSHPRGLRCGQCTFQLATPNAMVAHWTIHKVYPFQCKYCLYGNKSTHGIGRHQAFCHHTLEYSVICRIFVADSTGRNSTDYNYNEDEIYNRLLKWPEDSDTPEGKNLLKIYKNLPKLSGLEKTTVTEKEDDGNNKDPPIKANEIEVIQISMDDILAKQQTDEGVAGEKRSYEEPVIITNDNVDADDVDPLSFDSTLENLQNEMDEKSEEQPSGALDETDISDSFEEESVGQEEFSGRELFKCKCSDSFISSIQLRTHVVQCQKQKPFFCAHCTRTFKTVTGLLHHYRDHGRARFKCSLCQFKRRHQVAVRNHMKLVHNVGNVMLLPVIAKKVDIDNDDFVLRPRQGARKSTENSTGPPKPSAEEAPPTETKLIFGPNEIELLPRQPIYQFDVKCATCSYATKVKSNMVRHLQFHQTEQEVPVIAPVNPVPCLEKSEKMFDKMVNLASSSHVGGRMGGVKNEKADKIKEVENVNIPAFVPVSKRFICGAENCNYLCPEEAMLRRHLTAFHSDDGVYTCHHCKIKISEEKSLNIESVMKHLKLHDCNLYRCMYCKMIYHLRYKMDRHLSEKHFDKAPNLIIIREVKPPESDSSAVLEKELSKEPKPWRCGMCKYRCTTFNDIKTHASNKHFVDAKYKCAICSYKGEEKESFAEHFEKKHPGLQLDIIVCFYKDDEVEKPKPPPAETEAEFNTTPLWQRNKHVKHIRGILLDESNAGGKIVRTLVPKKLKSPKSLPPKKDDEEEVTTPKTNAGGGVKIAASPKRVGIFGIAETLTPASRANQKTYKIVKRALKSTKAAANSKVVKVSETAADKKIEGESSENEIIDVISCDEPTNQKVDSAEKPSNNEDEASPVSTSLKLVNIQTLLEDPSGSEMPGFVNISSVIRKPVSSGGDLETIEILDDADDGGDSGGSSSKKRKIDLTLREINKMSKDELLAGNYMGTYGPYGSPWDGKYKCPLCEKMTCRSEKEFTVHLYRELQYGAYKCNVCGETDLSEEAVKKHYVQKHGVLNSDDIVQMGWDKQIETWIHKVIAFQSRILKLEKKGGEGGPETSSVPAEKASAAADILNKIETEEDDKSKNLYCTFCDYKCKYSGDKRKHELRHWSTKPFSCDYCSYEAIYKSLIIKHIHRFHKDKEMSFHENNTGDGVVIKPVKVLKRKGAVISQAQAPEEQSAALQNSKETNVPEEALLHSSFRAQNLQCFYCAFVGTLPEQTAHHQSEHPNLTLKYYSYKCNYCEMVFLNLVSLNAHFFSAHPGLEQNFSSVENQTDRTFRCPTCLYTSAEYSVVKYHVRSHFQPFQCLYCNERFSYWNHIQKHHYETHPASIYEYKYLLSVEKETWKEMEAIQVKKGGSYKIFTEAKPAKRRKYPKKLDPTNTTTTNSNCAPEEDDVDDDDDVMIIEDEVVPPAKLPKPNETTVKVKKATARKSTGVHLKPKTEGFSYYGTKPDDTNLSDIITTVEIMGASVTMYVEQLSKIFNLFPSVLVEDCGHL